MKDKKKIIGGILALIAVFLIGSSSANPVSLGARLNGGTGKYMRASSTVVNLGANVALTIIGTSTQQSRDWLYFQAVKGDVYCEMDHQNGIVSMTNYAFTIGSTTPVFKMENGVVNGPISCISGAASTFTLVEANY